MNIIDKHKSEFEQVVNHLKEEISSLRTGRANPKLVEDIEVEAYGTNQELKSLASISVEDAKTLLVEPWDDNVLQDIEKALHDADIGVNPVNDGEKIRLPLPDLTAERRQELIKVLKEKMEDARIAVRKVREKVKNQIEEAEEEGDITEDQKYKKREELDKIVDEFNEKIDKIGEDKKENIKKM